MKSLRDMPPQYQALFHQFLAMARINFSRPEGLLPVFVIGSSLTGKTQIVGAEFGTKADKEKVAATVRAVAKDAVADYLFFVSEGYSLKGDDAEEMLTGKYTSVVEHPNHVEVVTARFETLVGTWAAEAAITRPLKLGPRELSNWAFFDAGDSDGTFSNFLDRMSVN